MQRVYGFFSKIENKTKIGIHLRMTKCQFLFKKQNKTIIYTFYYLLILNREIKKEGEEGERDRERERYRFIYVPGLGIKLATLAYEDDALSN